MVVSILQIKFVIFFSNICSISNTHIHKTIHKRTHQNFNANVHLHRRRVWPSKSPLLSPPLLYFLPHLLFLSHLASTCIWNFIKNITKQGCHTFYNKFISHIHFLRLGHWRHHQYPKGIQNIVGSANTQKASKKNSFLSL